MRVFLLDKSYDGSSLYQLKKRDLSYLGKVLRLDEGTSFTAKDINENYYKATLLPSGYISLSPTDNIEENLLDTLSGYKGEFFPIDIYVSVLKGKKNETVVRALTEMGVRNIVFCESEFCEEKDFSLHQMERLETIRKEAVQQSGGKTPFIKGPITFQEAVQSIEGTGLILHQRVRGKTKSLKEVIFENNDLKNVISVFVGPEGGFSDKECAYAESFGIIPILLKTNILRAETASLYIMSSLQTLLH